MVAIVDLLPRPSPQGRCRHASTRGHEEVPIRNDRFRSAVALALILAAPTGPLSAQDGDPPAPSRGPLVLDLSASTRAIALGGAFWTGGDGNLAILHHPALIAGEGFGGTRQRIGAGSHLALGGSGGWMGGTLAAGVSFLEYGTSAGSPLELPRTVAELVAGGDGAAAEFIAAAGYANEILGVRVGTAVKLVGQRLAGLQGSTMAVDLGLGREIGPITGAVTVQNLGSALKVGRYEVPLARRVVVGVGTGGRTPVGPFDVGGAVQVARDGRGEIIPGGGLEIAWWPVQRRTFILRIGAVRRVDDADGSPFTLGVGFEGDRIRIDYARHADYAHLDLAADRHSFGIAIR